MPQQTQFDPSSILSSLFEKAQDAIFAMSSCIPCGPSASSLKLNGRNFQIIKLLGEGGFSFVYLVKDESSGRLFALKKIRCSYGSESFREAMQEIEATKRFRSPFIIQIFDSCVTQDDPASSTLLGNLPGADSDGPGGANAGGKVIYLFLPFYEKGNLQDAINAHLIRGTRFGEREILELFLGTCKAVKEMHTYRLPNVGAQRSRSSLGEHPGMVIPDRSEDEGQNLIGGQEEDEEDQATGSYPPKPYMGANGKGKGVDRSDQEPEIGQGSDQGEGGEMIPYAHRDIKPGNVMIADDGRTPILMDFGSTIKARVPIKSRREAVAHQDMAAERSSMPYRAPELFDVKTDVELTESVDIWSLGCTLFAMAYLHSPFETPATVEQGGSIALAVMNGSFKFPTDGTDPYSEALRDIIRKCIQVDSSQRPDIHQVIRLTEAALRGVS